MIHWPPDDMIADENAEPPEEWEDWQKEQLARMQAAYKKQNDYWRPTIEKRRQQEWERQQRWAEQNSNSGWV